MCFPRCIVSSIAARAAAGSRASCANDTDNANARHSATILTSMCMPPRRPLRIRELVTVNTKSPVGKGARSRVDARPVYHFESPCANRILSVERVAEKHHAVQVGRGEKAIADILQHAPRTQGR